MYTYRDSRLVLFSVVLALMLFTAGCNSAFMIKQPSPVSIAPPATPLAGGDLVNSVRLVAQKVRPAVVQITSMQVSIDQMNQASEVPVGVGSGVILDRQGYILTNYHVIEGAQQLLVGLPDGRSFEAKLIGGDSTTDLAIVQINAPNLPVADLGDSGQMQVGDWVVAIGNALALEGGPTVTVGVVSALGRTIQEAGDASTPTTYLYDLIQTSAPINTGNSGGPLLNLAGQVVGINTLVAGSSQGIGFSISVAVAKPVADQLIAAGKVLYPDTGFSDVPLSPTIAAQLGIQETNGIVVRRLRAGSPAERAGLQRHDVITTVDGQSLVGDSDLQRVLRKHKPGDTLALSVIRGTQKLTIELALGELRPQ